MSYTKQKTSASLLNDCGGYNLIMTAISLVVIGVITVSLLNAYMVYDKQNKVTKNQEIIANAINRIQTFKETYGRFPCPSSLNAQRSTVEYGREDCTTAITAGSCTGGICVSEGRTIAPAVTAEPIRTGAIPFRLLQIDEKMTYDAYGSRLVYSMTQNMSSPTTFNELNGAIGLVDETGQTLTEPAYSADFLIISQGPNRVGAFNANGDQVSTCTGTLEGKNCINLAAAPASPTNFVSSLVYLSGGTSDFDDSIEYFSSNETARWRRADGNLDDIQTVSLTNVGVGLTNPTVALDIDQNAGTAATTGVSATWKGGLRVTAKPSPATAGKLQVDSICSSDGTECFRNENFATTGMTPCPGGQYMVGIRGNGTDAEPICSPVRVYCPEPQILTGIVQSGPTAGTPICAAVQTNCEEKDVQVCNAAYTAIVPRGSTESISNPTKTRHKLSGGPPDDGRGIHNYNPPYQIYDQGSYAPNKAWARFVCDNGDWKRYTGGSYSQSGGMCECNPTIPTGSGCTASPPSASCSGTTSCRGAGVGAATVAYTFDPVACQWNGGPPNYGGGNCNCPPVGDPSTKPGAGACPAGTNAGNDPPDYTWNNHPDICAWQPMPSTCSCDPSKATPAATASGDIWNPKRPGDARACNTFSGRAGEVGNAYQTYRFNGTVGACRWEPDAWDFSGCSCTTGLLSEPGTTTCDLDCQNQTVAAVDWYRYEMPGCVKTWDHKVDSVCAPKSFSWQVDYSSPPLTNQTDHGSTKVGDACNQSCMTNNVQGSTTTCWAEDTPGYKIYTCICKPN